MAEEPKILTAAVLSAGLLLGTAPFAEGLSGISWPEEATYVLYQATDGTLYKINVQTGETWRFSRADDRWIKIEG